MQRMSAPGLKPGLSVRTRIVMARKRILAELAKCELVCANCHAIRTYTRKRQTDPSDEECYSCLRGVA
jgi:hypothetical protein